MTAEDVLALLREEQRSYAVQDNISAAQVARVLTRIIERIENSR